MENPCVLHSTSAWKQEQWESAALPLHSPGTAPSPATSTKKIPITFRCRLVNKINLPSRKKEVCRGGIFFSKG